MTNDYAHSDRQAFLKPSRSWDSKLALCFFAFVCVLLLATEAFGVPLAFRAVMCPPDWKATVAQRYDDRDDLGWITKRTWIARCY
jgi:hypothetical protein